MRYIFLTVAILCCGTFATAEPISFNKDIRPILADRCFTCHGPDTATREAGLRFDREEIAKSPLEDSGETAIVAGKPAVSELMIRLTSGDPDLLMPPPDSKLKVSKEEIELIRRWIAEGAKWERHWAFIPPVKAKPPTVKDSSWPRNEIDNFILRRLVAEGFKPTRPADKERWLRRVTFDLTGLPPTIAELDNFLADNSDSAYETAVDRLLGSRKFGQRMAQEWLDVARYGDTDGLFEDHPRAIYPWRDWVVEAFNSNLPYSDFLNWQIAGDLLPNATVAQKVATGFIRNNPTSNEGGIIDEDYRIKYLIDRINTTATATMGLTLECAQCHDHKYDPMTQREYYQFSGFFNSLVGNGNTKGSTAPTLRSFTAEQAARLPVIDGELAKIAATLKSTPTELTADFQRWSRELEQPVQWQSHSLVLNKSVQESDGWLVAIKDKKVEPALPSKPQMRGRFVRVELPKKHVGFLTISEVQVFSNGQDLARAGKATQSSVGYSSPASKAINGNHDGSFGSCSCTNSEANAWWEVDLGDEFPIDSIAVWNRTDCCPERMDNISIQVLDEQRKTTSERTVKKAAARNALPADAADQESKTKDISLDLALATDGIAALQFESRSPNIIEVVSAQLLSKDDEKKSTAINFVGNKKLKINAEPVILGLAEVVRETAGQRIRLVLRTGDIDGIRIKTTINSTAALRASLPKEAAKRLEHFRQQWPGFADARASQKKFAEEKKQIEAKAALTMIASDVPTPRKNYLLMRGEYDKRGEVVETAPPASIMAVLEDSPKNRLGLANWLTHRDHPLTARVAVNRYWQMIFGSGIVKTSEDFGTQGDRPSHRELLDYLAVDFMESDWDVKQLLRKFVLSATYRQASHQNAQTTIRDPDNRLLSHGPRRRLQAEFVRDHALAISGLLVETKGGPGVNPYQPAELFGRNAIGSSNAKFNQSSGDDLYRRSLYTYWKRQIPAANMRLLGADGRNTCRTRREQTNTPLQALVLLNDPQFVEAARVMAERSIREGGDSPSERLGFAFRLATSRRATKPELAILLLEFNDRLKEFQADVDSAKKYLAGGGQRKPAAELDSAELAAYAAVCSLIFNLDESISSS